MVITEPINQNNFLRFTSVVTPNIMNSQYTRGLHSGNRKWRRNINSPLPALKTETYTFYTNFSIPTLAQDNIVLVSDRNCVYTILTDPAQPNVTATSWGVNNIKIQLNIPLTSTENTFIRIAVVNDGVVTHVSNSFLVLPFNEERVNNTHLFKFYHDTNIYGYEWADYNPLSGTPYTVRIPSTRRKIAYPRDVTTYESATTGRPRNTRSINRKDETLEIYFRDDNDHDALATFINFKSIVINTREYVSLSYEPEYNVELNIYAGALEIRDIAYSIRI